MPVISVSAGGAASTTAVMSSIVGRGADAKAGVAEGAGEGEPKPFATTGVVPPEPAAAAAPAPPFCPLRFLPPGAGGFGALMTRTVVPGAGR